MITAANLQGLPAVFSDLKLVTTKRGKDTFNTEAGPLAEILTRITNRAEYGDPTSGKALAEWFGREPYGSDFEVVRLMAAQGVFAVITARLLTTVGPATAPTVPVMVKV